MFHHFYEKSHVFLCSTVDFAGVGGWSEQMLKASILIVRT